MKDKSLTISDRQLSKTQRRLLLVTAAVSSGCGLAVELLLGTLASYLVGNQALAYGVAVGGFLAAMGIGSYLSQFIAANTTNKNSSQQQLLTAFIKVELLIAPLTALLPLGLFALFIADGYLWLGLFLATVLLGILAGLEVPLLTRVLELETGVREALAGVLALDYLGALLGSLAFPVLLLPWLGMFPTAFVLGAFPALMAFLIGRKFVRLRRWGYVGLVLAIALIILSPLATSASNRLEDDLYQAPIVRRFRSAVQRIVLTRQGEDLRLFLDGDLQLSTFDEYRYHEALVHPAMSASSDRQKILIMGAGDGMALREVLKWQGVEVTLIELDPAVVRLAKNYPQLVKVNQNSFADPRVKVIYGDAFQIAPKLPTQFDVIIADFPDPDREIIAKLYAVGFYRRLLSRLSDKGVLVTQASSPFFAPKVISCIAATIAKVGLIPHPYVVNVPSFGLWGFVLASRQNIDDARLELPVTTRFLTATNLHHLFDLPGDITLNRVRETSWEDGASSDFVEINRLSDPVITRYQSDRRWFAY